MACIVNNLKEYDESVVDGSVLSKENINNLCEIFSKLKPVQIKERYERIMLGREDIILAGSIILLNILELLKLEEVIVSSKGLRYGAIIHYLNKTDMN